MATTVKTKTATAASSATTKMGAFFGELYSFNVSLKLYHWHVTGKGSYAEHMALDQALESMNDTLDRLVETSYALYGDIKIVVPASPVPANIVDHVSKFFQYTQKQRSLFGEDFTAAIIDDYQEAMQQLLYRLKRLQ